LRCTYPEPKPTRVWEIHTLAVNGASPAPQPSPLLVEDLQ
jgi:hypothetical protein